jgi:membrane-bound lytic murein transglycosylase D
LQQYRTSFSIHRHLAHLTKLPGGILPRTSFVVKFIIVFTFIFTTACSLGSGNYANKTHHSKNKNLGGKNYSQSPTAKWRPTKKNTIPYVSNARVKKWVKLFNGRLKPSFRKWVHRIGKYGPIIEQVLEDEGAPKDLIYLSMIESGFNLQARSHAAAVGPWQFISSTGKIYGLRNSFYTDDRQDLIKSTKAAARHLKDLHKIYKDWYLAFSAYNAGPGTVNRAIRRLHKRDYWKLSSARSRYFRQETKDYVPKFLAAMHIVKNYRKYGYSDKSFGSPIEFDRVTVPDATDIKAIAKSANTSTAEIDKLNPALVMGITPPNQHTTIYIPKGTKNDFARNYSRIPTSKRVSYLTYRTAPKETLVTIGKKYKAKPSTLAKINRFSSKARLKTGTLVKIPASKTVLLAMAKTGQSKSYKSGNKVTYYRVRAGDNLSRIAKKYRTSTSKVAKWNKIAKTSRLKIGQRLKIYKKTKGSSYASNGFVTQRSRKRTSGVAHIILQDQKAPAAFKPSKNKKSKKNAMPTMIAMASDPQNFKDEPAFIKDSKNKTNPDTKTKVKKVKVQYHTVKAGESLSTIAAKHHMKVSKLKAINGLKSNFIRAKQRLALNSKPKSKPKQRNFYHTVKAGETLSHVAAKNRVKVSQLKSWNNLKSNNIRVGKKLLLRKSASTRSIPKKVVAAAKKATSSNRYYTVKPGETLSHIAVKNRVSIAKIKKWNALSNNKIKVGQKLKIIGQSKTIANSPTTTPQTAKVSKATTQSSQQVIFHRIKPGETLWSLSRKYRVKISDIMKWNKLKNDQVKPNQKLKIIAKASLAKVNKPA